MVNKECSNLHTQKKNNFVYTFDGRAKGIYCLTFHELCGDAPYSPMYYGNDPEKGKMFRPIIKHVCDEEL